MMRISGKTAVYGIMGWPVTHSLSPWFQNAFLREAGVDAVYVPFPVEKGAVPVALAGLHAAGVAGLNVTVPHKEALPDDVRRDDAVRAIGAANTLRRSVEGWEATNTDWQGVRWALRGLGAPSLAGRSVLVFGAGGTARAVLHALARMGAEDVRVANRSADRLRALLEHAGASWGQLRLSAVDWTPKAIAEAARASFLVINTTSIGLAGEAAFPFPLPAWMGEEAGGLAMDAVYRPDGRTAFLAAAAGRRGVDGLPMLVAQGAASFAWWHGVEPDATAALHDLEKALGRRHAFALREVA
ncbi:MAG: shikimate dehydrogenase [Mariprofundaceae bacterium]